VAIEVLNDIVSVNLYRSLQRLHLAIKACAGIGFEESSPTRNAGHYAVWMDLNEAQKDAEVKLKGYENFVLREKIRSDPDDEECEAGVLHPDPLCEEAAQVLSEAPTGNETFAAIYGETCDRCGASWLTAYPCHVEHLCKVPVRHEPDD
jgi:hypothetical protein